MGSGIGRIAVVVFPGFDELDAFGPYEMLRIAAEPEGVEVRMVGVDGAAEVEAAHGSLVRPHGDLGGEWSLVVVPGGGWRQRRGAFLAAERGELPRRLAELHAGGATVASVCTGAMLLAAAGLLAGRPAITHGAAVEDLRAAGAEIVLARVVDDGDVVTSGGITSGIDLGLWLVERLWSRELADRIAHRVEHTRSTEIFLGPRAV